MPQVQVLHGAFAGQSGELVARAGDSVSVRLLVFGRALELSLPLADVQICEPGPAALQALRAEMHKDRQSRWDFEEQAFWLEADPQTEPRVAHAAWKADLAARRARLDAEEAEADALFDEAVAGAEDPHMAFDALRPRLMPEAARRAATKARWRTDRSTFEADSARSEQAWDVRRRAEGAADDAAFAAWCAEVDPPALREARQAAAEARVASQRGAIADRVWRDWGLRLPESFFRFLCVWEGLAAPVRAAAAARGLHPMGLCDLLKDPSAPPAEGLDPRLHGRYFRDPPEFLTFLHGGTDGLHWGLWFDVPEQCAGVCSYYSNDGIDLLPPAGSPLGVLRAIADEALLQAEAGAATWALRLLREATVEAEEQSPQVPRAETLDGAGAVGLPEEIPTSLGDPEARRAALRADDLSPLIEAAMQDCEVGLPLPALVLGRDLHWLGRAEAGPLLIAAYTALGRGALAGIAAAHHENRELAGVGVLRTGE
jgi:hypothetical protein